MRRISPILVLGPLLVLGACAEVPGGDDWNVVLVVADTLRADRMSLYGFERETTPVLDAMADELVVFEEAQSQAGCTFPSVISLLTGRYPARFVSYDRWYGLSIPEDTPSLAEILSERGWRTAAISASPIIRESPSEENPDGGYGRGFGRFHEECEWEDAGCVNRAAEEVLADLGEPFFLYLHYIDPHQPYRPPRGHRLRFLEERKGRLFARRGSIAPLARMLWKGGPEIDVTEEELEQIRTLYDEEVAYLDRRLGELVEMLRQRGHWDRTLFVLVSDHGEELLDHGLVSHCRDMVWETVLSTPLLFRIPGVEGRRVAARAQNVDVVPTLLDLLGIEPEGAPIEGRSLVPTIESGGDGNRYLFAMQGVARSVRDARWKLTLDLQTEEVALFDLEEDPGEGHNVAADHHEVRERLLRVLLGWIEATEGSVGEPGLLKGAEEIQRHLEAVGYL